MADKHEALHDPALDTSVEPGVWRYVHARRASLIIDAAPYFTVMQEAMLQARKRILLVGWDFDTRVHLTTGRRWYQKGIVRQHPSRLGSFFPWLTNHRPQLQIAILKWSFGVFKLVIRSSMWWDLLRWMPHPRIDFKFDSMHPVGCSHHQKIVAIDGTLAVCGGIDMTIKRWDTPAHLPNDPRRRTPSGRRYGPWHDATMMVEGDAANALDVLGRDRWRKAGGKPLPPLDPGEKHLWPESLPVQFENVELGIARTRAKHSDWGAISEIEKLFVAHIRRAKRFFYAESQYFASRVIAEAIAARLEEENPPEFVIVHPAHADGWLEQQAMDHARAQLVRALQTADKHKRFSIWIPYSEDTPIYVHAKVTIVDDEILRVGSANMNNRSLGLDSECDIFIDAARPANAQGNAASTITQLRRTLMGEHCELTVDEVAELETAHGSLRAVIEHAGEGKRRQLRRYHPPELNALTENLAESTLLDPERPEALFEPYARGGLFRPGTRLARLRERVQRKKEARA